MKQDIISIRGAKEHNLKNVSVDIPRGQFVVITGLSGSGKSSLAFDTLYAEGQRRYVESLSSYARQFLNIQDKPDVESIDGLSPAIAIDQKTTSKNPRSTVGTVTEIYDYLRLLYARIGIPYSPATGKPIEAMAPTQMTDVIMGLPEGTKLHLLAPIVRGRKGEHTKEIRDLKKRGFTRMRIDGKIYPIEETPSLDKNKKHDIEVVVDRLVVKDDIATRVAQSVETALEISDGLIFVEVIGGETLTLSAKFACPESGFTLEEIEPRLFSFNSPFGACPECDGLGTEMVFDAELIVPDESKSLYDGAIAPWSGVQTKYFVQTLDGLSRHYKFSLHDPYEDLPQKIKDILLHGSGDEPILIHYHEGARSFKSNKPFEGVIPNLLRRWRETDSAWIREEMEKYQNITACAACGGHRLKPEALCVKVGGLHVGEVTKKTIEDAAAWFSELEGKLSKTHRQIADKVLKEITERLGFLNNVGLDYLTLARESGTLSGGESQRIRLASQIGSGLSGVLYVLDEPSIGLHQCDNDRLLHTLAHLRDLGNTVIVVEHDEDTMRKADHLIDMGPGAGVHGGRVMAQGRCDEVEATAGSVTGDYLAGRRRIAVPPRHTAQPGAVLRIVGARGNSLRDVTVEIPVGLLTCVTGVSGSGKSTLVNDTLYTAAARQIHRAHDEPAPHDAIEGLDLFDKVIAVDQSPIGRTPRSNPATYTGLFTPIRELMAEVPTARERGYGPGRFSFNVSGGRCEACQGDGVVKVEMHFLPDVYVPCDVCHGQRYNRETLEVLWKGKNIAQILDMTVEAAHAFFRDVPAIERKLHTLLDVGLSYIRLGQSATTLSGGEAQRVKLALELSKRDTGRTLYILDEPTTGLHFADIDLLLKVLHQLRDAGNTIVVIEHNLDVIKTADWLIDMGPEGGAGGGTVVGIGTPEDLAANPASFTGRYLARVLHRPATAPDS